jgi:signal transduction histidine kinase
LNILTNSVKFTSENGEIKLLADCIKEKNKFGEIKTMLQIIIADNGRGIKFED